MNASGADVWHTPAFMAVFEQHLGIIKKEKSDLMAVESNKVDQFRGDFFGLLRSVGINPQYWVFVLRATGLKSPVEFDIHVTQIIIPNFSYLEELRQQYQTIQRG